MLQDSNFFHILNMYNHPIHSFILYTTKIVINNHFTILVITYFFNQNKIYRDFKYM